MTFRELLEKYKDGTLTEEEKKLVEAELEKNEAINDYLAENLDLDHINTEELYPSTNSSAKKIKHTVNRKLSKIVTISVLIVFAIIGLTKYVISPIVASQYYNPSAQTMDKYLQDDFLYDLRAINELVNPGLGITYASAKNKGYGNYNLTFSSTNLFTQETSTFNGQMNQNEPIGIYDYFLNNTIIGYNTLWSDTKDSDFYQMMLPSEMDSTEKKIQHLKELPNTNYVSAYMLLDNELTLEELRELMYKYETLKFNWAAIRVSDDKIRTPVGFRIDPAGDCASDDVSYYEEYPALLLGDYYSNNPYAGENGLVPGYEKHFKSLLQYLSDHNDSAQAITHFDLDFEEYLNYVETNGIKTYGVLVFGTSTELVSFYENENIQVIYIDNVLPSEYSTKIKN